MILSIADVPSKLKGTPSCPTSPSVFDIFGTITRHFSTAYVADAVSSKTPAIAIATRQLRLLFVLPAALGSYT